jgi:hypothetical protein
MRFGWTLLLPLAVLNVVITAIVVALGWPWWINGLAGLAVILAVLFYERRKNILSQTVIPEEKMALPSSVRLAKFEKVVVEQEAEVL